ncbi:MAG: terminase family protein [Bryobacteraceae bacterium]
MDRQEERKCNVKTWELEFNALASQRQFVECAARFKGFSGPVGSGKSMALCFTALRLAIQNPGCQGLLGAPTYRMMRDVTQVALLRLLDENAVPYEFAKSDNIVRIGEIESEILLRSLDEPERLRGTNLAWFGIDELTFTSEDGWTRLEARLRDPRAKHLCGFGVWTPNGQDWVYRRFIQSPVPGYECVRAKPLENKFVLAANPDFYKRLEFSYDERFYRQEVLGEYLNIMQGRVYESFDRERNVREAEFDPRKPLYWSLDFNVSPLCSVLAQEDGGGIRVIAEICLQNATVSDAVEALHSRIARAPAGLVVTGDASGRQRSVTALGDAYAELRRHLGISGFHNATFRVPMSNPAVLKRVKLVNAFLQNASGEVRLTVDPSCHELKKDFEEVVFKPNEGVVDKARDARRTHISDALGYLVWELYGDKPSVGEMNRRLI